MAISTYNKISLLGSRIGMFTKSADCQCNCGLNPIQDIFLTAVAMNIHFTVTYRMSKDDFWQWFDQNKIALEDFLSQGTRDYTIYEALSKKLKQFNEFLIPELTLDKNGHFILIISCDGMKQGIPFVEQLTQGIKEYSNWLIVKYRQPGAMAVIPLDGLNLKRKNIYLTWNKSTAGKYELTFYVKGYTPSNRNYEIGTLLHLDHSIGEFNAMTKVVGVKINRLGFFQSTKDLRTLDDLTAEIETL
jgi:hypothetical protein